MGNTKSEFFEPVTVDLWWNNEQTMEVPVDDTDNQQTNQNTMEEVREEISTLHEKRLRIIAEKKKEMDGLRENVARQKKDNEELRELLRQNGLEPPSSNDDISIVDDSFEVPGLIDDPQITLDLDETSIIKQKNLELQLDIASLQKDLQGANSELAAFENERQEYKTHVTALKDIITVSKQLLLMREKQIKELGDKVTEIEASLAERELKIVSNDLREEYIRQLQNIKQLRVFYDERQRIDKVEREKLKAELEETKIILAAQEGKTSELQARVDELEEDNSKKYDTIIDFESQLGFTKAECAELRSEMSVINQLFSQILTGVNNRQDVDLDKLIKNLEENHDLLTDIVVNEESNELSSALPKVLLDLVSQVNEKSSAEPHSQDNKTLSTITEESESQNSTQQNSLSSASEIVQNLPKVWKVLTELLSHQTAPVSVLSDNSEESDKNPCYKSVETPTGPALVLSVSKTYIRLKDLIIEKKSLEKETTRLKQLNTHLETRLQDQEKRLETVSDELSKTWHVVGKMQKQHQQLHTQEKILRYELAQKRKLLNELKEELEYCREKWMQAREKNSTTEEQWKQLRNEFAARKNTVSEDLNNSVESGYSDERSSSDDDESAEVAPGGEPSTSDTSEQTILEVVQDEITKIEEESKEEVIIDINHEQTSSIDVEQLPPKEDIASEPINTDPNTRRRDIDDMYKKLEQDILQTIKKTQNKEPSTSKQGRTTEEILAASEERAKRVEEQSNQAKTTEIQEYQDGGESSAQTQSLELISQVEEVPSTSSRTPEEMLARREERLQRMEEQAQQLVSNARRNSLRNSQFCNKLNKLHDKYGESSESSDDGAADDNNNTDGVEERAEIQSENVEERTEEEH